MFCCNSDSCDIRFAQRCGGWISFNSLPLHCCGVLSDQASPLETTVFLTSFTCFLRELFAGCLLSTSGCLAKLLYYWVWYLSHCSSHTPFFHLTDIYSVFAKFYWRYANFYSNIPLQLDKYFCASGHALPISSTHQAKRKPFTSAQQTWFSPGTCFLGFLLCMDYGAPIWAFFLHWTFHCTHLLLFEAFAHSFKYGGFLTFWHC